MTEVLFSLSERLKWRRTKEQRGKEKREDHRSVNVAFCHNNARHIVSSYCLAVCVQ